MKDNYLFPFSTCEIPNNNAIIAQPYSFVINLSTSLIVLFLAIKEKIKM